MKSNNIKIQEGGKITDRILSLVFFALGIAGSIAVYLYFNEGKMLVENEDWLMVLVALCPVGLFMALNFAVVHTFEINLKKRRYRNGSRLGPINFARWNDLPNAEYITAFRQGYSEDDVDGDFATTHVYDINLWYDAPKCITLTQHHNRNEALRLGITIAERLDIGLVDATIPNDHKWLREMPAKTV